MSAAASPAQTWVFASLASMCVACEVVAPLGGLSDGGGAGSVWDDGGAAGDGAPLDSSDPVDAATGPGDGGPREAAADATDEAPAPGPNPADGCVPTPPACDGTAHACDGVVDEGCPDGITIGTPGPSQILGGSSSQGAPTPFSTACPAGQVLVGVGGSTGQWMDAIYAVCGVVTLVTDKTTVPYTYSVTIAKGATLATEGTLGGSDTPFTAMCQANEAVVGVAGNSGAAMDSIVLSCAPLAVSGSPGSFVLHQGAASTLPSVGDTGGGSPFTPFRCPDPAVITAVSGYAGQWLGELGVACGTPSLGLTQ